ncbi:MAG: hypothetical protein ACKVVT_16050 [Dehalococcoidia bacterium]
MGAIIAGAGASFPVYGISELKMCELIDADYCKGVDTVMARLEADLGVAEAISAAHTPASSSLCSVDA